MAGGFRELKIWQKAFELDLQVRKLTQKYPKEEKYALVDQTNRSADAVPALIAESHGRFFAKDEIRVLYEARGEIEETQSHLLLASEVGYLTKSDLDHLDNEYEGLLKGISAYIRSLKKLG